MTAPTTITLSPQPLTQEDFAPFGQVIAIDGQEPLLINGGNTERYDNLAQVELAKADDFAAISIFRGQPRPLPMTITMMERHPLGSQAFMPLSGEDYLVLVGLSAAEDDSRVDPASLRLFHARPDQGVNYARNTWHHPLLGLGRICDFLVVDRKGGGHNCEEYFFDNTISITLPGGL